MNTSHASSSALPHRPTAVNTIQSIRLVLDRDVTIDHCPGLRKRLLTALSLARPVTVDMSRLTRVDSATLAVLIEAVRVARDNHVKLRLYQPPQVLFQLFSLFALDGLFVDREPEHA